MMPFPTVSKATMPVLFHEPHVERGFRPIHQPWKSYLLSLFQWHNELMNTWTHLIALFMVLIRGCLWWCEFSLLSDPYMWPISVAFVTTIALYCCSAGAHLFHSRSEIAHFVCFMIDYAGIGLYGFGSTMLHYWYCTHESLQDSYLHQAAIPVGALLGVITCYCCSYSKVKYERPYPFERRLWQIGSVACIYLWLSFPLWIKIVLFALEGKWEPSFGDHLMQTMWFTLGGFFFGSDIPQRMFPGKFDFVGHSHQLFHVCIMMTTYKQLDGVYYDVIHGIDKLRQSPAPTFLGTWGALIFVVTGCLAVVYNFYFAAEKDLEALNAKEKAEKHFQTNGSATEDQSDAVIHSALSQGDAETRHRQGKISDTLNGNL